MSGQIVCERAYRLGDLVPVGERLLALDAIGLQIGGKPAKLVVCYRGHWAIMTLIGTTRLLER